jgi:hypothetical protein
VISLTKSFHFFSQLIVLSASANKLSKLKEQAEEYASLIMEELDPENLGYIEVWIHAYKYTTATCQYLVYFC